MPQIEEQLAKEIELLLVGLIDLKHRDLPEYFMQLSELKKDLGIEFYNTYLRDSLEI